MGASERERSQRQRSRRGRAITMGDLDTETRELLAECEAVGPLEIIPDGEFEPTADKRF